MMVSPKPPRPPPCQFGSKSRALPAGRQLRRDCPSGRSIVEWRELVPSIGAERKGIDFNHRRDVESAIEMRKQGAAARGLPLQPVAEPAGLHTHQHQVVLAGKM